MVEENVPAPELDQETVPVAPTIPETTAVTVSGLPTATEPEPTLTAVVDAAAGVVIDEPDAADVIVTPGVPEKTV